MDSMAKILIVDDEPFNVDYLEQELEDMNYSIITATNGREALNKLVNEPPDLILLDIMMPIMDGFELCSSIKSQPELQSIGVIVLTALSDPEDIVRALSANADCFLITAIESRCITNPLLTREVSI